MAVKKYTAIVYFDVNGGQESITKSVDLANIDFAYRRMCIQDDVVLPARKDKAPLPDFGRIQINGEFDCANYTLQPDSVLPSHITALRCLHSINDFDVLLSLNLPSTLKKIYIRKSVMNNLRKDESALKRAKEFISKHSDINVYVESDVLCLNEMLDSFGKKPEPVAAKKKAISANSVAQTKSIVSNGYIDINMAAEALRQKEGYKKFSSRELKSKIKNFLYENAEDKRWGSIKNSILEKSMSDLEIELLKYISSDSKAVAPVVNKDRVPSKVVRQQKSEPEVKKSISSELKPTLIKKYIYKSVWGSIKKACDSKLDDMIEFLNNINLVNINPTLNRSSKGKVVGIQNGQLKIIPNLDYKNGYFIAQSFGPANNRPRVLWVIIKSDTLVASHFFDNHGDGKNKNEYNSVLLYGDTKGKVTNAFKENPESYLDIDDLLSQLREEKRAKAKMKVKAEAKEVIASPVPKKIPAQQAIKQEQSAVPAQKVVVQKQPVVAKATPASKVDVKLVAPDRSLVPYDLYNKSMLPKLDYEPVVVKKKRGRPRIDRSQTKLFVEKDIRREILDKVAATETTSKIENTRKANRTFEECVSYTLHDVYDILNRDIYDIKTKLLAESDCEKSLSLTNELTSKLKEKQLLESNMEIVKKSLELFNRLVQEQNKKSR